MLEGLLGFLGPHPVLALLVLLLLDVPRNFLAFVAVALERALRPAQSDRLSGDIGVTAVIPAYNSANSIINTLRSLQRQTLAPRQIILVDDGSTDETPAIAAHLRAQGLIDIVIHNERRMGVAGGSNKALLFVNQPFVLFLDADTRLAPDACGQLVSKLQGGEAAASGNLGVVNAAASLWTALQQIEYMTGIDFGRSFADRFNAISCLSGAMTLFRTEDLLEIGGFNAGSGQDLDVTLRLRRAGKRIRFASRAWGYTHCPTTLRALVRQRFRWDRDALRIHVFGHHQLFRLGRRESLANTLQRYDFINFTLIPTLLFPALVVFLWRLPPDQMSGFLAGLYLLLIGTSLLNLAIVFLAYRGRVDFFSLLLLPLIPLYQGGLMPALRFYAFVSETVWRASRYDNFVPARIRAVLYRE